MPLVHVISLVVFVVALAADGVPSTTDPSTTDSLATDAATTDPASSGGEGAPASEGASTTPPDAASPAPDVVTVDAPVAPVDESLRLLVEAIVLGDTTPGPLTSPSSALFAGRSSYFWGGLRAGALKPVWGSVVVGGDGTFALSRSTQGTSFVGETWTRTLLEGRGLVGYRFQFGRAAFTPYGLASARLELGLANLTVLREPRYSPLAGAGARVGAGLMLDVGNAVFRTDCANGVRTFAFDVGCTFGVGARF